MNTAALPPFRNEPFTDFSAPDNHRAMLDALARVRSELGRTWDLVLGGHPTQTATKFTSTNPARPAEVIGTHYAAGRAEVETAIAAATAAFPTWSRRPAADRVEILLRTAQLIRERHLDLCAWLVFEVGKNWAEADADVGECIDFLEFYAREALKLDAATTPIQYPGERNDLRYVPLGVGAVIPPWNFPFAIMAGMTAAAIVTGNTVVLKPSPDAPTIAARFVALLERGRPARRRRQPPPGRPRTPAASSSKARKVHFIAFTGSKKVGLEIHERAARTQPGQRFIKRTILEMGGKDAIVVAADANVDAAVEGVVASAFGFNGQKCSACSRAIVEAPIYDAFTERLRDRVAKLKTGDPAENAYTGPVINKAAYDRVLSYINIGQQEGKLLAGGAPATNDGDGYFIQPTVFGDVAPDCPPRAGRDLRPRPRRHQGRQLRPRARDRQRHRVRPHRRHLLRLDRDKLEPRRATSSTSAISTSIASAPEPWWARTPSAAST